MSSLTTMLAVFCFSIVLFGVNAIPARPLSDYENNERERTCGRYQDSFYRKKRMILYGEKVQQPYQAPFAVAMRIDNAAGGHLCSGTMISRRHIITAAHCFLHRRPCQAQDLSYKYTILAKCLDATQFQVDGRSVAQTVSKAYIPRDFYDQYYCNGATDNQVRRNDIAIIELEQDMPFENDLYFACLAHDALQFGQRHRLFGYGLDADQNLVETFGILKTMTGIADRCERLDDVGGRLACFTNQETLQATCSSDSGSGVSFERGGKTFLNAVMWGGELAECKEMRRRHMNGDRTAFESSIVDLSYHLEWICLVSGICVNQNFRQKFEQHQMLPEWQRSQLYVDLFA